MEQILRSLRYTARRLVKAPTITATVLLILAIATGFNTAIFSAVDAVLLRPLPFRNPGHLVLMWESTPIDKTTDEVPITPADFLEIRHSNRSFDAIAALKAVSFNLTSADVPEKVSGARVSATLFSMLGVKPVLGREFTPEEELAGNDKVAIIANTLWRRRFNSDPTILGKNIVFDGNVYTVVGVMPAGFEFPGGSEFPAYLRFGTGTELWKPLGLTPDEYTDRSNFRYVVLGRVKDSTTLPQARSDLAAIVSAINARQTDVNDTVGAKIVPLQEQMVREIRPALLLLWGASFLLLSIACVNVTNILLAHANAHRKQIAIQSALGASRSRIVGEALLHSVTLSIAGGLAGCAIAVLLMRLMKAYGATNLQRLTAVGVNGWVLGCGLLVSIITGILFGLVPARTIVRHDLIAVLNQNAEGHSERLAGKNLRRFFIILQVSLSVILVSSAFLAILSFAKLLRVDLGFQAQRVLTMNISLPPARYASAEQRFAFFRSVLDNVRALPGVKSTAVIDSLPLSGSGRTTKTTIMAEACPPDQKPWVEYRVISPDYFSVMNIPLLRGRNFAGGDSASTQAIINQEFAERCWPNQDATGQHFKPGSGTSGPWLTIVGVVKDVRSSSPEESPQMQAYLPYFEDAPASMALTVQTASDPAGLIAGVQRAIWAVDKQQPVDHVGTMNQFFSNAISRRKFQTILLTCFALAALLLAATGIYGLASYLVVQRRYEMGIRAALGATDTSIVRLILKESLGSAGIGVLIGVVTSWSFARVLQSFLYEVQASSPVILLGIALFLIGVVFIASYFPARRAAQVDPLTVLRAQ